MEKIKDLQVVKLGGNKIHAEYLIDDSGDIWYKEGSLIEKGYQGPCWTCTDCVNWIFNAKTVNDVYQCRPLPPHTSKCKLINEKYPEFDITFKSNCTTHSGHSPCRHFIPSHNYEDWNINQFIDVENCCKCSDFVIIQGISKNGKQAPFSFRISKEDWYNLNIIENNSVKMFRPIIWETYNSDNVNKRTRTDYSEEFGISKNEIKKCFELCFDNPANIHNGKYFNFDKMWFL